MKKLALPFFVIISVVSADWYFSNQASLKEKIIQHIENGEIEQLSTHFSSDVYLNLFDEDEYESFEIVHQELTTFFTNYPPIKFKERHSGMSRGKLKLYLIGILQCEQEVFRMELLVSDGLITDIIILFEHPIG